MQKLVDDAWNREVEELYAGYAIYDQAEGAEQAVFDQRPARRRRVPCGC